MKLEKILNREYEKRVTVDNLQAYPDPLQVAKKYMDPRIALICALFAYGNAKQIVKFLNCLNFDLLNLSEEKIRKAILEKGYLYRFQTPNDVAEIFVVLKRLEKLDFETIIYDSFNKNGRMVDGLNALICQIYKSTKYSSPGFEFYFGKNFTKQPKSPYKRLFMWLRWMVRKDNIDLGLFTKLPKSKLILPLDTHTHNVSQSIGLCNRKTYDYNAALEITENLSKFDIEDPVKYDFALYRIGQSGELNKILEELKISNKIY